MTKKNISSVAESQINDAALDDIVKSLSIPPQPIVLQQLQAEMGKAEPDVRKAARIVSQDVGLTVAVLKTVNSPMYGLLRKAETVDQAVSLIGLSHLSSLVAAIAVRGVMQHDNTALNRFYDSASRRAYALGRLARESKHIDVPKAQMFGLFCDVAIPLLIARFPTYSQTLNSAEHDEKSSFSAIEHAAHHTDHALVGALMAKTWGLPKNVCLAIRLHHEYSVFLDAKVHRDICVMIAMGLIADAAIHRHAGTQSVEWIKGGDYVAGALVLAPEEVEDWIRQLVEDFAAGIE